MSVSRKTVTYNSTYGDLITPSRAGYTFTGWYTAASGGSRIWSSSIYNTAGNTTLYAQWQINTATYCSVYGHTVTNWVTTENATCQHGTIQSGTCNVCGARQQRDLGGRSRHYYTGHWNPYGEGTSYSICNYCGKQVNYYIEGYGD